MSLGSDVSYNEALNANPHASIKIELKNGKTVPAEIVLTGKDKPAQEPIFFMGVFDRSSKEKLLESDLKKIEIDSGKSNYEYDIQEGYAGNLRLLFQRSQLTQAED